MRCQFPSVSFDQANESSATESSEEGAEDTSDRARALVRRGEAIAGRGGERAG
jgi:hypothetical protein